MGLGGVGWVVGPASDGNSQDWERRLQRSSSSSVIVPIAVANMSHPFYVLMLQRISTFVLQLYCLA